MFALLVRPDNTCDHVCQELVNADTIGSGHSGASWPLLVHDPCSPRRRGDRLGVSETVLLITHGESGRSGVGCTRNVVAPTSLAGQFEQPYGPTGPPTLFTVPVFALHEDLRTLARAIGDGFGRAAPIGGEEPARPPSKAPHHRRGRAELADDRLPVRLLQCSGDRWRRCADPGAPGRQGAREASPGTEQGAGLPPRHRRDVETPMVSQMADFTVLARLPVGLNPRFRWSRSRYRSAYATMSLEFPCQVSDDPQT